jgi:uncharacterized membrane protein YhaH (DUF805 family)
MAAAASSDARAAGASVVVASLYEPVPPKVADELAEAEPTSRGGRAGMGYCSSVLVLAGIVEMIALVGTQSQMALVQSFALLAMSVITMLAGIYMHVYADALVQRRHHRSCLCGAALLILLFTILAVSCARCAAAVVAISSPVAVAGVFGLMVQCGRRFANRFSHARGEASLPLVPTEEDVAPEPNFTIGDGDGDGDEHEHEQQRMENNEHAD